MDWFSIDTNRFAWLDAFGERAYDAYLDRLAKRAKRDQPRADALETLAHLTYIDYHHGFPFYDLMCDLYHALKEQTP